MKTIKDMWESFKKEPVPEGRATFQKMGLETAFYSGALAALVQVLASMDKGVSEEEGSEHIANMFKECTDFRNSL